MALHVCTSWNNELVQCHVIQNPFSWLSVGLVSNHISDGSSSGNLCRLPSSLANLAKKDKKSFCICPGRMILIFPDLPKTLQKSPFFPSNSFVYLFVPVGDWLQLQWSAWSDLLYSTDVWFSQLPLFADICYRISPGVIPVLGKESEKQPLNLQDLRGTFLIEKEGKKMGKSFLRYLKCELLW